MTLPDGWFPRFALLYAFWPVVVMLAFVIWSSVKSDTILGLLRGIAATIAFALMALLGWFIGSIVVIFLLITVLEAMGLSLGIQRIAIGVVMALAMVIGSVLGWKYLDAEMGSDARNWRL